MLAPARYLADFGRFTATRKAQEQRDAQALASLVPLDLPPGLEVQWLGVSGYRMTYERQTIFIDPYVSRVPLVAVLRRRVALPDPVMVERFLARPDTETVVGCLIGHTHFDHAVDAPAVVARYRCPAYGSESLRTLLGLHGLAQHTVVVEPKRPVEVGPFTVTFHPSLHSKLLLGLAVPAAGELTCDQLDRLNPSAYRCGQVWGVKIEVAGTSFYHQGSCNLIDEDVPTGSVDVFLAGVAGRGFTERYWERILRALQPRTVVPTHFDDFFRPLDGPQGFTLNVNLAKVPGEIERVSSEFEVRSLPMR
jgi:L-ascorbate metabolism protein UlaG (beta-lactamase superfamily)